MIAPNSLKNHHKQRKEKRKIYLLSINRSSIYNCNNFYSNFLYIKKANW